MEAVRFRAGLLVIMGYFCQEEAEIDARLEHWLLLCLVEEQHIDTLGYRDFLSQEGLKVTHPWLMVIAVVIALVVLVMMSAVKILEVME